MSTINDYRDEQSSLVTFPIPFKQGFDAAMDLRLAEIFIDFEKSTPKEKKGEVIMYDVKGHFKYLELSELYQYWLNNVYQVQEGDATMLIKDQMPGQKNINTK